MLLFYPIEITQGINIKEIFEFIQSYDINHVDLKQEDLNSYNEAFKAFDTTLQIEVGQYLAKIPKIMQQFKQNYKKDIQALIFNDKESTFVNKYLDFDQSTHIMNIQKRYEIEFQKQLIQQGSSPFLVYYTSVQNFPDEVSRNSYFFLQWFLLKEFMILNKPRIPFEDIKIIVMFFINEVMLKKHLEQYKEFILHYPPMTLNENPITEEQNKFYFEQKTIELCYILTSISTGEREDIVSLVQFLINNIKQYQTIVVNILLLAIQYFLTMLDIQNNGIEKFKFDKQFIQVIIGEKCNPNKSILFKSMKQQEQGSYYIKYQNQNYDNFMNSFYIWNIFDNYKSLITMFKSREKKD